MDHSHFWGGNKYLTRLEDIQRHFSYNRVTRGSDFHLIVYWVEVKPLVSTWSIVKCRWCTADTRGNKYWTIWIRILTFMPTKYIHLILKTGAYMGFFEFQFCWVELSHQGEDAGSRVVVKGNVASPVTLLPAPVTHVADGLWTLNINWTVDSCSHPVHQVMNRVVYGYLKKTFCVKSSSV